MAPPVEDGSTGASDPMSFTHNILFLHDRDRDRDRDRDQRVTRTRSGSLVPDGYSPVLLNSPMKTKHDDDDDDEDNVGGEGGASAAAAAAAAKAKGSDGGVAVWEISEMENLAFLLISFGYMVPWTSLGSLISYFKHTYNAEFYNKLYCAYYLPGLPVAYLQHRFDGQVDMQLGSRNAYMLRGVVSFLVMITILVLMVWWREQATLIFLFTVLGIFSWLCHGTASMLASMYPATAIAYLQTGFRCPEIYTIAIVAALNIGSHPSNQDLDLFFSVTAAIVAASLVIWIWVAGSAVSKRFFDLKDARMNSHLLSSDTGDAADEEDAAAAAAAAAAASERAPLLADSQSGGGGGGGGGRYASAAASYASRSLAASVDVEDSADDVSDVLEPTSATEISRPGANSSGGGIGVAGGSPGRSRLGVRDRGKNRNSSSGSVSVSGGKGATSAIRMRARQTLRAAEDASMRNQVYRKVFSLCLALFITIWCSIFQASFFAYCDSPQGRDIEQILYFVRLFSDLLGRPLTRFARPWFLQENHHVLNASVLRISLMLLFFLYIFIPNCPRSALFSRACPSRLFLAPQLTRASAPSTPSHSHPRSDLFISFIVGIFSALSGYLTVLIYEYAAEGLDGAAQTYATGLLNMSFQLAAFTAVLLSVFITSSGWIDQITGTTS